MAQASELFKLLRNSWICIFVFSCLCASNAKAGGLFGDVIEGLCGGCGVGRQLDREHERLGSPLDIPGRVIRESHVETLGPLLAEAIRHSRNNARSAGVYPIPNSMKSILSSHFSSDLLDRVRYRVGQGHELSVQSNAFRFGDAAAVALIDSIVFANQHDALNNDRLWAHELGHILQYEAWGLSDFAKRYVRDWNDVERDAENTAERYVQSVSRSRPAFPQNGPMHALPPVPQIASACVTPFAACGMLMAIPRGSTCYCQTFQGAVWGQAQ